MRPSSQAHISLIRKLKHRKYRDKEHRFLIEGKRTVLQVLNNKILHVESIHINDNQLNEFDDIKGNLFSLDSTIFDSLSNTETPQGIIAIGKIPEPVSLNKLVHSSGIIVATDALQDPGNMGTIIRSSAWYGASALLVGSGSVDIYNPKVIRSTAGATGVIPTLSCTLSETLPLFKLNGWDILLLDNNEGAQSLVNHTIKNKTVLIVGNEANGISDVLKQESFKRVFLPSKAANMQVESLNAGVALSIALAILDK